MSNWTQPDRNGVPQLFVTGIVPLDPKTLKPIAEKDLDHVKMTFDDDGVIIKRVRMKAPKQTRGAAPVGDDDDEQESFEVATTATSPRGPPPDKRKAPDATRRSSKFAKSVAIPNHNNDKPGTKGRKQESSSLIAVNDGQRLCGYVRGRLAYDSDLHELGEFKSQAAAMVRVLDCARLGEKGARS